jgi:phospholipase C
VPVATEQNPNVNQPSHLQQVHAELVSQLPVPDSNGGAHHTMPPLKTNSEYSAYIRSRTAAWTASKKQTATDTSPR